MSTPLLAEFEALVDREWDRMANAGTWWTGTERVAIATEARLSYDDAPSTNHLSTVAIEAARRVSAEAATIRQVDIDRWADGGLDPFAYVELIGVVSRLAAIDVTAFGLGMDERPLPVPQPGNPSLERPPDAVVSNGWVPTIGPAWAPGALSAVPDEVDAMFDIHGVLYLSMEQMRNNEIVRNGIHRAQIELTAARTSWLNECFY
jgi:hypothetical protein